MALDFWSDCRHPKRKGTRLPAVQTAENRLPECLARARGPAVVFIQCVEAALQTSADEVSRLDAGSGVSADGVCAGARAGANEEAGADRPGVDLAHRVPGIRGDRGRPPRAVPAKRGTDRQ